jgi:hypothetical protein
MSGWTGAAALFCALVASSLSACGNGGRTGSTSPPPTASAGSGAFCLTLESLSAIDHERIGPDSLRLIRSVADVVPAPLPEDLRTIADIREATAAQPELPVADDVAQRLSDANARAADVVEDRCGLRLPLLEAELGSAVTAEGNTLACLDLAVLRTLDPGSRPPSDEAADTIERSSRSLEPELQDAARTVADFGRARAEDPSAPEDPAVAVAATRLSDYVRAHCTFSVPLYESLRVRP